MQIEIMQPREFVALCQTHPNEVWKDIATLWEALPQKKQLWHLPEFRASISSDLTDILAELPMPLMVVSMAQTIPDSEPEFFLLESKAADWSPLLSQMEPALNYHLLLFEVPIHTCLGRYFFEAEFDSDWLRYQFKNEEKTAVEWPRNQTELPPNSPQNLGPITALKTLIHQLGLSHDIEIAWAIEENILWVYGIRPLDAQILRNDSFSVRHFQELLPPQLPPLMQAVLLGAEEMIFDFYRQFDADLSQNGQLLEVFQGRPYLNETLLSSIYRRWGRTPLPTGLPVESTSGQSQAHRKYQVYLLKLKKQIEKIRNQFMETFQVPHSQPSGFLKQIQEIYALMLQSALAIQDAMRAPLSQLNDWHMLEDWRQFCSPIISQWFLELMPLRDLAQNKVLKLGRRPTPKELLKDPQFRKVWQIYLSQHGHRGLAGLNLSKLCIDEDQENYLELLLSPWRTLSTPENLSLKQHMARPVWHYLQRLLQLRNQVFSDGLWAMYQAKKQFMERLNSWQTQGKILSKTDVWQLSWTQLQALERRAITDEEPFIPQPSTVPLQVCGPERLRRFEGPENDTPPLEEMNTAECIQGQGGIGETREGQIWRPQTNDICLPEGFQPWSTILVVPVLHPDLMPYLIQVAGVISESEMGFDLGSLLLYELGLSSVQGVPHANQIFKTGESIRLEPQGPLIYRITSKK